jgi:multimeric flavodoxin WrbA
MKVIAFNGSARKSGNTAILLSRVLEELEKEGIETERVNLAGKKMRGCIACFKCFENQDRRCSVTDDFVNECIGRMEAADGIVLACPTYFANVSAEMKALIDRGGLVSFANAGMLRHKVGAAVTVARRTGAITALNAMNTFFSCFEMFTVGSSYPNMALGMDAGDVDRDEMGLETMATLGRNMAFLLKAVDGAKG